MPPEPEIWPQRKIQPIKTVRKGKLQEVLGLYQNIA
jgi:hypothetical protein